MWLQLGGHADGNPDIPAVAMREAREESGLERIEHTTDPSVVRLGLNRRKADPPSDAADQTEAERRKERGARSRRRVVVAGGSGCS